MQDSEKIAHRILSKNTKLLNTTVQDAQEEIFWVARQNRILYANKSACQSLGYSIEELAKTPYNKIDTYTESIQWRDFWEKVREEKNFRYETFHKTKQGILVPVEVSINHHKIVDREFFSAICFNIGRRLEAQQALEESEERFRIIAEMSVDNIIHLNSKYEIVYSSPACFDMFGLSADQMSGKPFSLLINQHSVAYLNEMLERTMKEEEPQAFELDFEQDQQNGIIEVSSVSFKLKGDEKGIQLIIKNITERKRIEQTLEQALLDYESTLVQTELLNENLGMEIEERKKAEKELIKARRQADEANSAKSEFLANMSHEIRTPLNAVLGFAEILKDKLVNEPDLQTYIDGINTGGRSLLSLINDILDLSKIEAGRLEIQKEPINPRSLLIEVEQIFSTRVQNKSIALKTIFAPEVPTNLLVDQTRIRQILFNLVGNAIKFTTIGSVVINMSVEQAKKENAVDLIIKVSDTGIGIPRKQQKLIFDPFKQKEGQSTRKYGGTGLGLTITRRLVNMMNGSINVESRLNKGTTFTVTLKDVMVASGENTKTKAQTLSLQNYHFEGSRVLIVEDNQSNQQVLLGLLENAHLKFFVANNGKEATDKIHDIKPDLVFMDIRMPVMDGVEAAQKIRNMKLYRSLPIVALSASMSNKNSNKEFDLFTDTLSKPIKRESLVRVLAEYLPHTVLNSETTEIKESNDEYNWQNVANDIELTPEQKEIFKEYCHTHIEPKLDELKDFIDTEDVEKLIECMKEIGTELNLKPYIDLQEKLLRTIKTVELKKTELLLNIINQVNKQILK